ncbi:MAG: hypothetical protein ACYCO9_06390 [Streptosporangiaceae bacterium]
MSGHAVRRWPLVLIAAPAAVAVWSGWVGLGTLCGFGLVTPLPGIVAWHLNTAITLPVGVEAYGAYALGAWLAPAGVPATARKFARRSAVGALLLGMTGQVIYHLLAAAHADRAPWPVVVLVSCLPVVTLGFGAALTHLLRLPAGDETTQETSSGEAGPLQLAAAVPSDLIEAAKASLRATLAAGNPLSLNQLQERFSLTRAQATKVRQAVLTESNGHNPE